MMLLRPRQLSALLAMVTVAWSRPMRAFHVPDDSLDPYAGMQQLHFKPEGFKLMVVSDTHLLDGQGNSSQENVARYNAMSQRAVEEYLEVEKPDFVVHLGDMVSGEAAHNASEVRNAIEQILTPLKAAGVPFSTTKGNHDNEKYSTHGSITDMEHAFAPGLSYTRKAPAGVGGGMAGSDNYWVPIYKDAKAKRGSKPALLLWFFDSRSGKTRLYDTNGTGNEEQKEIPDWVDPSVGQWISSESQRLQRQWSKTDDEDDDQGSFPPSLIFTHIPAHEFVTTQSQEPYGSTTGGVSSEAPGNFTTLHRAYPGLEADEHFGGQGGESTSYEGQDRAYLESFFLDPQNPTSTSRCHGIVSGHQHGNDWCAPSSLRSHGTQGKSRVPLCFAKHSGFGGYDDAKVWNHGVRVFHFDTTNVQTGVETYVKFLTGEKRYNVQLDEKWLNKVPAKSEERTTS